MKYIKDILNLQENKSYKITIIFLVIVIFFLQISMITTVKKTVVLVQRVRELNSEISELKLSNININKESYSIKTNEKEEGKEDEKSEKKDKLIRAYVEIAESVGKKYNSNISTGNRVMVFEAINLEMTENQIKKTLTKINSEEFGIEIEENKIQGKTFYKIYLIENPVS